MDKAYRLEAAAVNRDSARNSAQGDNEEKQRFLNLRCLRFLLFKFPEFPPLLFLNFDFRLLSSLARQPARECFRSSPWLAVIPK